jgi:hypothetical protein
MWKKYLQRIILTIIVILGIKTGIENFTTSINEPSNDTAVVTNWNNRLSKLIAQIPIKRGFVGYISNEDILGASFSTEDNEEEYVLTQYTIAPLILIRGTDQEWNILNLEPENYKNWMQKNSEDFEFVKSGGGMYLVHKVNK